MAFPVMEVESHRGSSESKDDIRFINLSHKKMFKITQNIKVPYVIHVITNKF
jgi:hypothetical protein